MISSVKNRLAGVACFTRDNDVEVQLILHIATMSFLILGVMRSFSSRGMLFKLLSLLLLAMLVDWLDDGRVI